MLAPFVPKLTALRNIAETTVQNLNDFAGGKSTANGVHAESVYGRSSRGAPTSGGGTAPA